MSRNFVRKPSRSVRQLVWFLAFISPLVFAATFLILGVVTPGYDPLNFTISRLALERYGSLYSLSLVLLSSGLFSAGIVFGSIMKDESAGRLWKSAFSIAAVLSILMIMFPTDPIENVRFSLGILTPSGMVHISAVVAFIVISLPGIRLLAKSMSSERDMSYMAWITRIMGYGVWALCILWIAFYLAGMYMEYRGLFQKIIALITILWLEILILSSKKPYLSR